MLGPTRRTLEKQSKQLLRKVTGGLRVESIHDLVKHVEDWTGRPITLHTVSMPADTPCGLWAALNHEDRIYYEENTSELHRDHIIAHELGHIVHDHHAPDTGPLEAPPGIQEFAPNLDPELVRAMFGRSHFDAPAEAEAETFATLAVARIGRESRTKASDAATERFTSAVVDGIL